MHTFIIININKMYSVKETAIGIIISVYLLLISRNTHCGP